MTEVRELQSLAQQINDLESGNDLTVTASGCGFRRLINNDKSFATAELAVAGLKGYLTFLEALEAEAPVANLVQVSPDRLAIRSNNVTRPAEHGYWANKAYHETLLIGDGYLSFRVPKQSSTISAGLHGAQDPHESYAYCDHHFRITSSYVRIYAGSSRVVDGLTMEAGDIFEIERINGILRYYIADELVYTTPAAVEGELYAHIAFYGTGLTVEDVEVFQQPKLRS